MSYICIDLHKNAQSCYANIFHGAIQGRFYVKAVY